MKLKHQTTISELLTAMSTMVCDIDDDQCDALDVSQELEVTIFIGRFTQMIDRVFYGKETPTKITN